MLCRSRAQTEGNWKGMFVWFPTAPTFLAQGESGHCLGGTLGLFIFLGPAWYKVSLSFTSTQKNDHRKGLTCLWQVSSPCSLQRHFSASFLYHWLLTENKKSKLLLWFCQSSIHSFITYYVCAGDPNVKDTVPDIKRSQFQEEAQQFRGNTRADGDTWKRHFTQVGVELESFPGEETYGLILKIE